MYLHHIMQQKRDSLLFRFFMSQLKNPTKGDWVTQVLIDMNDINLNIEIEQISFISKIKFKEMLKIKVNLYAFNKLMEDKKKRTSDHAKGRLIHYNEFKIQDYFLPSEGLIPIIDKKWIFKCRVDDVNVKGNNRWKYDNISCVSCNIPETQKHVLECMQLLGKNEKLTYIPTYEELFNDDTHGQAYIAMIIRENVNIRAELSCL